MQAAGQKAIDHTPSATEQETLEQLTHRAKVLIAKADNQMISAGQVLKEIKTRVTDKSSGEANPGGGAGGAT